MFRKPLTTIPKTFSTSHGHRQSHGLQVPTATGTARGRNLSSMICECGLFVDVVRGKVKQDSASRRVTCMTWSGMCCLLKENWSLTLSAPLSPCGLSEQLQQPELLGLHPRCQEAKADGTHELYISEHLHFLAVGSCMLQEREAFCFCKL